MSADSSPIVGFPALPSHEIGEVGVLILGRPLGVFEFGDRGADLRSPVDAADEVAELLPLLDRDADQLADDRHRQTEGQNGHEVDLAGLGHGVEHGLEQGDDALLEVGDPAGREGPTDHAPQAGVLRRVLHEHRHLHAPHEPLGQRRVLPVAGDHAGAPPGPGVHQDGLAVVVAGGVPVAIELAAEQRGDVAQGLVEEIRILAAFLRPEQDVEDLVRRAPARGTGGVPPTRAAGAAKVSNCHGSHPNTKSGTGCHGVRLFAGYPFHYASLRPPDKGAGPAVIVIPEDRELCDSARLAEGFTALAPEPSPGQTAADLAEAIDSLKPHPAVRGQGIGVIGFGSRRRPGAVARHPPARGRRRGRHRLGHRSRRGGAPRLVAPHGRRAGPFRRGRPGLPARRRRPARRVARRGRRDVEFFTYPTAGPGFFEEDGDAARQALVRTLEFLRKHLG